jgi:hypothetical protein
VADVALREGNTQEATMERIRVLEEKLWPEVPKEVIEEAKRAAKSEPSWIAMQGNGHVVAMEAPGSPDAATGDVIYIAEVSPAGG